MPFSLLAIGRFPNNGAIEREPIASPYSQEGAKGGDLRSTLSFMVIMSLTGPGIPVRAQESIGPLVQAIERHAAQLAVVPDAAPAETRTLQQHQSPVNDWLEVRTLKPGTEIIVVVRGAQPQKRTFRTATELDVTVDDPDGGDHVVARGDVIEVRVFTTHGSPGAAILGVVAGAVVGGKIAGNLGYVRCQPSCGGVAAAMALSAVGIPVAAGLAGYHLAKHSSEDVIYRAP